MNKFDKVRRKLTTQLAVNTDRTRRRMRRLTDDELLSIYGRDQTCSSTRQSSTDALRVGIS